LASTGSAKKAFVAARLSLMVFSETGWPVITAKPVSRKDRPSLSAKAALSVDQSE
jgi:hypothetical protein